MARDARAFEQLYVEHEPALYRYLARRLGPTKAEDAVAEAFAAAWQGFPEVDPSLAVRTWLLGLAVRHLRARREEELEYLGVPHAHRVSPVALALSELDPIDRDMLTLRVWADLSDEGIAEVMHLPIESVEPRIRAAHDHVRRRAVRRPDTIGDENARNRRERRGNHS